MTTHRCLCACICLLFATLVAADDWPQWRGPDRTGVSSETGLARQWPEQGPPLVWEISSLGNGYGTSAIVGDRLYIQGTRGDQSIVFALDLESGRELWSRSLGPRLVQEQGDGPRSTPTVEGGVLYVMTGLGELAALDGHDGSVQWQRNILDDFEGSKNRYGVSESPLINGDHVVVMPGGEGSTVAALNKHTGETVWTSAELSDAAGYGSFIAADVDGLRTLIGFTRAAGVGLRASDGSLLWRYERPSNEVANVATPIYDSGLAFYSSSYGVGGGAMRLHVKGDTVEAEEAYFSSRLQNHHGGVLLIDGHLYSFFGRTLTCANFETGEVVWKARSVGKGSLTSADGLLFLVGENHLVGLAEASPDGYEDGGRFAIEDHGRPSWAHPVVNGGRLYIRNQQQLSVYDVSETGAGGVQ